MSRRAPHHFNEPSPAAVKGSEVFWGSLAEKQDPKAFDAAKDTEFPFRVEGGVVAGRREIVKFGLAAVAAFGLEGCVRRPAEKIVPYTRAPEQVIPGISMHYATVTNR